MLDLIALPCELINKVRIAVADIADLQHSNICNM